MLLANADTSTHIVSRQCTEYTVRRLGKPKIAEHPNKFLISDFKKSQNEKYTLCGFDGGSRAVRPPYSVGELVGLMQSVERVCGPFRRHESGDRLENLNNSS